MVRFFSEAFRTEMVRSRSGGESLWRLDPDWDIGWVMKRMGSGTHEKSRPRAASSMVTREDYFHAFQVLIRPLVELS